MSLQTPLGRKAFCRCLFYSAGALARKITRMAEQEFESTGLPPSHSFILMAVNKQPGISVGKIAHIMQLQPSTATRLVDKLEHAGYVTRQTDGRCILVYPTREGITLNNTLMLAWKSLHERYSRLLGLKASHTLTTSIYRANNRLDKPGTHAT